MYYVYILKSLKNGRYYTGSTANLERRLGEHNSGRSLATKFTKPFRLVYHEQAASRADAIKREKYFKTGKGRAELQKLLEGH